MLGSMRTSGVVIRSARRIDGTSRVGVEVPREGSWSGEGPGKRG